MYVESELMLNIFLNGCKNSCARNKYYQFLLAAWRILSLLNLVARNLKVTMITQKLEKEKLIRIIIWTNPQYILQCTGGDMTLVLH